MECRICQYAQLKRFLICCLFDEIIELDGGCPFGKVDINKVKK